MVFFGLRGGEADQRPDMGEGLGKKGKGRGGMHCKDLNPGNYNFYILWEFNESTFMVLHERLISYE